MGYNARNDEIRDNLARMRCEWEAAARGRHMSKSSSRQPNAEQRRSAGVVIAHFVLTERNMSKLLKIFSLLSAAATGPAGRQQQKDGPVGLALEEPVQAPGLCSVRVFRRLPRPG
jgi:hypothetical protein